MINTAYEIQTNMLFLHFPKRTLVGKFSPVNLTVTKEKKSKCCYISEEIDIIIVRYENFFFLGEGGVTQVFLPLFTALYLNQKR